MKSSLIPRIQSAAAQLAVAVVIGSLISFAARESWGTFLVLHPGQIFTHWAVWELFSYLFVGSSPVGVVISAVVIWLMGRPLELAWGRQRLLAYTLITGVIAALCTVVVGLLWEQVWVAAIPGEAILSLEIWFAYCLWTGHRSINLFGILALSGYTFAWITLALTVLTGAYYGWAMVVTDLSALGLSWLYIKAGFPQNAWLRFTSWRLHRQLRGRSKHLRVVTKDRNIGGGSDGFLH